MKKLVVCILTFFTYTMSIQGMEIDYSLFHSIDELIVVESNYISNIALENYEELADAYASRGESLLFCDRFDEALEDFKKSYILAIRVTDSEVANQLVFRALFGQAIVYGNFNKYSECQMLAQQLVEIIDAIPCKDCPDLIIENTSNNMLEEQWHYWLFNQRTLQSLPILRCQNDVPIFGPNSIPVQDCFDVIEKTVFACQLLISKAPAHVQSILNFTINQLAQEAAKCCRKGGLWKGCFQKLANKYHQWNQKWQLCGIPPDPAWD